MQRDILIFQNPVIVKGHNIFSLITPKATHVNKARERVKEISEFRQPHDGFKGEAACGARTPAPGAGGSLPAPCLCRPPGTCALRPEPPVQPEGIWGILTGHRRERQRELHVDRHSPGSARRRNRPA